MNIHNRSESMMWYLSCEIKNISQHQHGTRSLPYQCLLLYSMAGSVGGFPAESSFFLQPHLAFVVCTCCLCWGGHLTMLGDMSIMRDRPGSSDEIESRIPLTLDVVDSRD